MGHRVLKPSPEVDLYLVWTTVADGPIFAGKRKKVVRFLRDDYAPSQGKESINAAIERRLERVERIGSTDMHRRVPIWEDEGGGLIYQHTAETRMAWLPYKNLLAFTEEFKAAQKAATEDGWTFHPSPHLLEVLED